MPITTKVVRILSMTRCTRYNIMHYVIKFVSDLRQVDGFLQVTLVSSTNKTDRHDITKILLKVALSTVAFWSDVFRILLNVNHLVNGERNMTRRCEKKMFSYLAQVWLNINRRYLLKMKRKN